jgi:hypothetical protein
MTPAELRSLEEAGIDVQLHTHRHVFPIEDRSRALREIADNRAALRQWVSTRLDHFCYPSGIWEKSQWAWLESIGILSSTTSLPGLNSSSTPRHALRRHLDSQTIHPIEFEAALCGMRDILRKVVRPFS